MLAFMFLAIGFANVCCLFGSTGACQAAHGVAAVLCGTVVVAALIDANVKDDEVDHGEIGRGT